ncbi:hypothetical protein KY289_019998 [Solanum tuberosum]|nr:hypothetical protein KY289_019998 [Solanum tuberosum]
MTCVTHDGSMEEQMGCFAVGGEDSEGSEVPWGDSLRGGEEMTVSTFGDGEGTGKGEGLFTDEGTGSVK